MQQTESLLEASTTVSKEMQEIIHKRPPEKGEGVCMKGSCDCNELEAFFEN